MLIATFQGDSSGEIGGTAARTCGLRERRTLFDRYIAIDAEVERVA
jgi:hypothetical protein